MADETPIDEVLRMMQGKIGDADIIRKLTDEGYSPVQISDALNQAKIKSEIAPEGLTPSIMTRQPSPPQMQISRPPVTVPRPTAVPPQVQPQPQRPQQSVEEQAFPNPYAYPSYPTYQQPETQQQKADTEAIEEIAEEIVNEKWLEVKNKISDVVDWKTYAERRIDSLDERLKRIELSLDRLQAALLSKVQEYGRDVKNLGSEMGSLENAFGKILNPLVENVKELRSITDGMKEKTVKKTVKK